MALYRVVWIIDIDAKNPIEAAAQARKYQLDLHSTATVFTVRERDKPDAPAIEIDLIP